MGSATFLSYHPIWLRIVDDVRTAFQRKKEYAYIPILRASA